MMKKIFVAAMLFTLSLTVANAQNGKNYGKEFSKEKVMKTPDLIRAMTAAEEIKNVVVFGNISQVCQAEGCWMKLKNPGGEDVFVKFKDHAFLIPKDLAGHTAYVSGTAIRKTISVKEQRHMAEDAGLSEEEINKITEPKSELRIDATGVEIL